MKSKFMNLEVVCIFTITSFLLGLFVRDSSNLHVTLLALLCPELMMFLLYDSFNYCWLQSCFSDITQRTLMVFQFRSYTSYLKHYHLRDREPFPSEVFQLTPEPLRDLRDPTTTPLNFTKSINLALSERGINAMKHTQCSGLIDAVLGETIPMHGRMIHGRDKAGHLYQASQEYDVHGRVSLKLEHDCMHQQYLMKDSVH